MDDTGSTPGRLGSPGNAGPRAPIERIQHLTEIGRADEAVELIAAALTSDPHSAVLLRLLSRAEFQREHYQAAIDAARAALAAEPGSAPSLVLLANALNALPDPATNIEAMQTAEAALGLDPHEARCYTTRARIYTVWAVAPVGSTPMRGRGCYVAALADIDYALHLEPNLASSHALRGWVLLRLGERDQAKTAFEHALAINPQNADAQANLSQLAIDQGRIGAARLHAQSGVGAAPQSAVLHRQVGKVATRRMVWPLCLAGLPTVVSPPLVNTGQPAQGTFVAPLPLLAAALSVGFTWWSWKRTPQPERNALLSGRARLAFRIGAAAWLLLMALGIAHAFIAPFAIEPQYVNRPGPGLIEVLWNSGYAAFFLIPMWYGVQKVWGLFERVIS